MLQDFFFNSPTQHISSAPEKEAVISGEGKVWVLHMCVCVCVLMHVMFWRGGLVKTDWEKYIFEK